MTFFSVTFLSKLSFMPKVCFSEWLPQMTFFISVRYQCQYMTFVFLSKLSELLLLLLLLLLIIIINNTLFLKKHISKNSMPLIYNKPTKSTQVFRIIPPVAVSLNKWRIWRNQQCRTISLTASRKWQDLYSICK